MCEIGFFAPEALTDSNFQLYSYECWNKNAGRKTAYGSIPSYKPLKKPENGQF